MQFPDSKEIFITIPSGSDLKAVVDGFSSKCGFPQCVGAIDAIYLSLHPKRMPRIISTERNSILLFCRPLLIMNINSWMFMLGWPGSVHDARVLTNSSVFAKCENMAHSLQTGLGTSVEKIFLC